MGDAERWVLHNLPEQQAANPEQTELHQARFANPLEADGLCEYWELIFLLLGIHNLYVSENSEGQSSEVRRKTLFKL